MHGSTRRSKERLGTAVAGLLALLVMGVAPATARGGGGRAAPLDRSADVTTLAAAAETAEQRLGGAFAGAWLDADTGQLTVATTDARQADDVRALGAVPREVGRSAAALEAVKASLDRRASVAPASVAAWYVDVSTNSVVVDVVGGDAAGVAFAAGGGPAVRVASVAERPVPYWSIIGGQAIYTGSSRCSAGFNAFALGGAGSRYVITAGHCTNAGFSWTGVGGILGTRFASSFPGDDWGVIKVTSASALSTALVDRYSSGSDVTVAGSTQALIGTPVCRSGSTTGWRCGLILGHNQTVNYPQGAVFGLTRTSACAQPGDSGGSFVTSPLLVSTRVQAQGMTSGGSGNCTFGGTTYYQPVNEVLSRFALVLAVG